MSEKELYSIDQTVESEGKDTGRIKDVELARKMAEAQNAEQDKEAAGGIIDRTLHRKKGSPKGETERGKAAADKVAREEIKGQAKESYLASERFAPDVADEVAEMQVREYQKSREKIKAETAREVTELREKIKEMPDSYSMKDEIETEGAYVGKVKNTDLAVELADRENEVRSKIMKTGFREKSRRLINTITFRGKKNVEMDKAKAARAQAAGEEAANLLMAEKIKEKATREYEKMGYRTEAAAEVARDRTNEFRDRGKVIREEKQKQKDQLMAETGLKEPAEAPPAEEPTPAETPPVAEPTDPESAESVAAPDKRKKSEFKAVNKAKVGRYYEDKEGEIYTEEEYRKLTGETEEEIFSEAVSWDEVFDLIKQYKGNRADSTIKLINSVRSGKAPLEKISAQDGLRDKVSELLRR